MAVLLVHKPELYPQKYFFSNLHLVSRFELFDPKFPISRVLMLGKFAGADE